jgi:hypothetical protein
VNDFQPDLPATRSFMTRHGLFDGVEKRIRRYGLNQKTGER